jgi:hypothetical protein
MLLGVSDPTFSAQFWPALVATFLGVVAAILLGFVPSSLQRKRVRRETNNRLHDMCEMLMRSVRGNRDALDRLATEVQNPGWTELTTGLDVATWIGVRDEALGLIPNRRLRVDLVEFMAKVEDIDRSLRFLSQEAIVLRARMGGGQSAELLMARQAVVESVPGELLRMADTLVEDLMVRAAYEQPREPLYPWR